MSISNKSLVSVIMPVYNAEKYLEKAITSILAQTYENLEILIADDASTDNSKLIINSFSDPRIRLFHNETNIGYLKTCNNLFWHVKGEFVAFQDADDWSYPNRIEEIVNVLLSDDKIALCGCNFIRINRANGRVITTSDFPTTDHLIKKYIEKNKTLPVCGPSVILRKTVYDEVGGYREFYNRIGYEHFDWFLIINERYKTANIASRLYVYNYVENSFSRTGTLVDFKKYYVVDIAWFLRQQRLKYGEDAITNDGHWPEFETYLNSLRDQFIRGRYSVYKKVIFNHLGNRNVLLAKKILINGYREKELSFLQSLYLCFRIIRTCLLILLEKNN